MKSISTTLLIGLLMSLFTYFFIPTPQKAISGECRYSDISLALTSALISSNFVTKSDIESAISSALPYGLATKSDVEDAVKKCLNYASISDSGEISTYC